MINVYAYGQLPSVYSQGKDDWKDHNDSRHYDQAIKKYENEIASFEWGEVLRGLAADFEKTDVNWSEKLEIKQRFQNELDALVDDYTEAIEWAGGENEKKGDEILKNFATGRFQANFTAGIIYFSGRNNEIKLYPDIVTEEQAKDLRYRAETINELLNNFKDEARQKTVSAILKAETRWRNYLERGFSQYPWESFCNGYITTWDIQNPPNHQWILFHPELGVEVNIGGIKQLKAKEVLTVELAGWIQYYGEDLANFWGISGITTIRDDIGIGFGGIVHLGPHFNLGIAVHDVDNDDNFFNDDLFLAFGIDLFKFAKSTGPKFKNEMGKLKFAKNVILFAK
ncbi:hypothetical protein KAR91_10220 [Candidatus Pacearchaeota archaeon]|nr:hypothetical protein [Candidatus Pacearchaeota archaeon]